MAMGLGMQHCRHRPNKVRKNDKLGLTMTFCMERSFFYIDSYRQNFKKSSCLKLEGSGFWYLVCSFILWTYQDCSNYSPAVKKWPYHRGHLSFIGKTLQMSSKKTTGPVKAKFHMEPKWIGGTKVCLLHLSHRTNMAIMPNYYGKTLLLWSQRAIRPGVLYAALGTRAQ